MKKVLFSIMVLACLASSAFALETRVIKGDMVSAYEALSVTDANATHPRCRAVYIGTAQSLDFSLDGTTWVKFQNCVAGTILPIQVVGARKNAGSAAPDAGDVVFLY